MCNHPATHHHPQTPDSACHWTPSTGQYLDRGHHPDRDERLDPAPGDRMQLFCHDPVFRQHLSDRKAQPARRSSQGILACWPRQEMPRTATRPESQQRPEANRQPRTNRRHLDPVTVKSGCMTGGSGEIRTHGRLPVGCFQDSWVKPLPHASVPLHVSIADTSPPAGWDSADSTSRLARQIALFPPCITPALHETRHARIAVPACTVSHALCALPRARSGTGNIVRVLSLLTPDNDYHRTGCAWQADAGRNRPRAVSPHHAYGSSFGIQAVWAACPGSYDADERD